MASLEELVAAREVTLPLGVVIEKRKSSHPWADWVWRPVAVIAGARPDADWQEMMSGEDWTRYHLATMPLTLHRTETEAYKGNLASEAPSIYVVLRPAETPNKDRPVKAHLVTASPYEAQDYCDTDDDIVEKVSMPAAVLAWVQAFTDTHHVDVEFKKRRRDRLDLEEQKFGKEPIFQNGRRRS